MENTLVALVKIKKTTFIQAVISKALSEDRLTNKNLATQLDISEQWFYVLLSRYSDEIEIEISSILRMVRMEAIAALKKKLRNPEVSDHTIEMALRLSGDLKSDSLEHGIRSASQTIINVGNLEPPEIEQFIDRKLQEIRSNNIRKSQTTG